jgi:protein-L-isoaspartate(D-aspartate) O-methyltransferase
MLGQADYATARLNMVESQVRPNQVRDPRLIAAMSDIPRELFVPRDARAIAYRDEDLPLGGDRWLLEPMVFARLIQTAAIQPADRVLEVGSATGYGAAVLARLAAKVVALECDGGLARAARQRLAELRVGNVAVVEGELHDGYAPQAPYDVIVMAGAAAVLPESLREQLADGGRLVGIVEAPGDSGKAVIISRVGSAFGKRVVFDASSHYLPGFALRPRFVF